MSYWKADLACTVKSTCPDDLSTIQGALQPNPVLLLCRRLIEDAFEQSTRTELGEPTPEAVEAREWLSARTNWTLYGGSSIPQVDARAEYALTFDWCCEYLNEHPDDVRKHGLSPTHNGKPHFAGLPAVDRIVADARARYEANWAVEEGLWVARRERMEAAYARKVARSKTGIAVKRIAKTPQERRARDRAAYRLAHPKPAPRPRMSEEEKKRRKQTENARAREERRRRREREFAITGQVPRGQWPYARRGAPAENISVDNFPCATQ